MMTIEQTAPPTEDMTEKKWLEKVKYYQDIDEDQLKSIFYFSLIWNIFEKELCKNNAKITKHPENYANTFSKDVGIFQDAFEHFKSRYVSKGNIKSSFVKFYFGPYNRDKTIKEKVTTILLCPQPSNKDKLKALLYIAFRLRNNLFHGVKDVKKLYASK